SPNPRLPTSTPFPYTTLFRSQRLDPLEQPAVGGAAAQEDVLPVVGDDAVARERVRRAAQPRARLQQRDLGAGVGAVERRRDAGEPATHDDNLAPHALTAPTLRAATHAFSHAGREIRRLRIVSGRRSIRSRMPR